MDALKRIQQAADLADPGTPTHPAPASAPNPRRLRPATHRLHQAQRLLWLLGGCFLVGLGVLLASQLGPRVSGETGAQAAIRALHWEPRRLFLPPGHSARSPANHPAVSPSFLPGLDRFAPPTTELIAPETGHLAAEPGPLRQARL